MARWNIIYPSEINCFWQTLELSRFYAYRSVIISLDFSDTPLLTIEVTLSIVYLQTISYYNRINHYIFYEEHGLFYEIRD